LREYLRGPPAFRYTSPSPALHSQASEIGYSEQTEDYGCEDPTCAIRNLVTAKPTGTSEAYDHIGGDCFLLRDRGYRWQTQRRAVARIRSLAIELGVGAFADPLRAILHHCEKQVRAVLQDFRLPPSYSKPWPTGYIHASRWSGLTLNSGNCRRGISTAGKGFCPPRRGARSGCLRDHDPAQTARILGARFCFSNRLPRRKGLQGKLYEVA